MCRLYRIFFSFRFTQIMKRLALWGNCESVSRRCELCGEYGGKLRTFPVAVHYPSLLVADCRHGCVSLDRGCDQDKGAFRRPCITTGKLLDSIPITTC